jgi:hypothetical protein
VARGLNRDEASCLAEQGGDRLVERTNAGELRKTRLFRPHEQAELVGAIADTRTMFERNGWA